ncbi:MAG: ferrous iron transport protein A [Thermodesulfobacteriota bacterium]|nr:ferrous iron transport protein A [Thermodesulfobacteriota bacterium]
MKTTLNQAPFNETLRLAEIDNPGLLLRFQHIGLYKEDLLTRLDEEILVMPVKVKGSKGERVLGRGMATKVVVHLDDGRKFPLAELKPGTSGHIEGIVGGTRLADALATLGLENKDEVKLIRRIPPMEYTALVGSISPERVHLSEGIAAKIWGTMRDGSLQFSAAARGKPFHVKKILGGEKAHKAVFMHGGIAPGVIMKLEGVKSAEIISVNRQIDPVIIVTHGGLRLMLEKNTCGSIWVEKEN